jgi:hypothetical protein
VGQPPSTEALRELTDLLTAQEAGPVEPETAGVITELLSECWDQFAGHQAGGMESDKLLTRTTAMTWNPPRLVFEIERHGLRALGSVYDEIQRWCIDLSSNTATYTSRKRIGGRRDPPLNVEPLVTDLVPVIVNKAPDERLKWLSPDHFRLNIGKIIPATTKQTTSGRRGRFVDALVDALRPLCWKKEPQTGGHHIFRRNRSP